MKYTITVNSHQFVYHLQYLGTWMLYVQNLGLTQSIFMTCAAPPAHKPSQYYWPALSHIPL